MEIYYRPTRAEISLDALKNNLQAFRHALPPSMHMMAVVKADAYGHGAVEVAKEAIANGIEYLGVAFLDEALELRQAGIHVPILVMGYTPPEGVVAAVAHDITLTVYSNDLLELLTALDFSSQQRRLKVHVKIDTGMGRIGLSDYETALAYIDQLLAIPTIEVEGLFTHYAKADEIDKSFTMEQYAKLSQIVEHYKRRQITFSFIHAGNSATAIDTPELSFNMIRIGISMYGMYPSAEVNRQRISLQPVMRLVTQVTMLKTVEAGTAISYGGTFVADKEEQIATLPIGYADGYSRRLSQLAEVLIQGMRVPVVGRICMDQCMINVTGLDVKLGDEVVVIGEQGVETILADELADKLDTINYEITSLVSRRVPRVYFREKERIGVTNYLHR